MKVTEAKPASGAAALRAEMSQADIDRLVEEYDPESNFRQLVGVAAGVVTLLGVTLSLFHVYTAGFGLLN